MAFNRISHMQDDRFDFVGFWYVSPECMSHFGINITVRLDGYPYDYEGELYDLYGKSRVRLIQTYESDGEANSGDLQMHRAKHERPRQRTKGFRLNPVAQWDLFRGSLMGSLENCTDHLLQPDHFTYVGPYNHYDFTSQRVEIGWFALQENVHQKPALLEEILYYRTQL